MGRPINKRLIGQGAGKILCSAYYFNSASEVNGAVTPAWIVSQRSTNKFIVSDGTTTQTLTLANETAGSLAEGTFIVNALKDDSTVVQVTKLRNRTVQYEGGTANVENIKFVVGRGLVDDEVANTVTVEGQNG
jgi:hypothetical protein